MPRIGLPALVAAHKRFGLTVEVVRGAETRGSEAFNPYGYVGHHTAGARTGVRPSLNLCVVGRSDLAGPLCNVFLDRNGVAVIVACGRANHAGAGGFRGLVGNSAMLGCEAEDDGDGTWTAAQLAAYPRVIAAGLWLIGRDASWYCSHRTWAPTRKVDPAGLADGWMRARVTAVLANPHTAPTQEDDMDQAQNDALMRIREDAAWIRAQFDPARAGSLVQKLNATGNRLADVQAAVLADSAADRADAERILGRLDALDIDLSPEDVAQLAAALDLDEDQVAEAVQRRLGAALTTQEA